MIVSTQITTAGKLVVAVKPVAKPKNTLWSQDQDDL
jgi:hypothetical protein